MRRRAFLAVAGSCAAHLALSIGMAVPARRLFAGPPGRAVSALEPWGRIERIADGAWALVSTPLAGGAEAMRTFANGGIVAGRDGVLAVEGFASAEGAAWMAQTARELTGRFPDWIVLTHHHGDHASGLHGYEPGRPLYVSTSVTRDELGRRAAERGEPVPAADLLGGGRVRLLDAGEATFDLGGRRVRVVPRRGHTRSDLAVVLEDPPIVWCGDLVWSGYFPNYVDALPSELSRHARALLAERAIAWVPGHGGICDPRALEDYVALLDDVEAVARRAIESGTPAADAARGYRPPASLGEWVLFSPRYYEVALTAWERELA